MGRPRVGRDEAGGVEAAIAPSPSAERVPEDVEGGAGRDGDAGRGRDLVEPLIEPAGLALMPNTRSRPKSMFASSATTGGAKWIGRGFPFFVFPTNANARGRSTSWGRTRSDSDSRQPVYSRNRHSAVKRRRCLGAAIHEQARFRGQPAREVPRCS